jgi:fructokinase
MFLICGEALYDFFLADEGNAGNLSFDARPGGSPYNVAIGMSRLGASSALLTGMSDDMLGARLASILEAEGVACDYLVRTQRRTTLSLVGVDESGGPSYAFYGAGSADCSLTEADLPQIANEVRGLHFGSYSIAVNPVADAFAALLARTPGRFVSLDPNVRPTIEPDMAVWTKRIDALRPQTTLLKVSDEDIAMLHPGANPVDIVKAWAKDGPALVVLTQGGEEAVAVRGEEIFRATPPKTKVVDTVGAGDTFMASLLAEMSKQDDPAAHLNSLSADGVESLLKRAATAAAITCSRRGADLPTAADLAKVLEESA